MYRHQVDQSSTALRYKNISALLMILLCPNIPATVSFVSLSRLVAWQMRCPCGANYRHALVPLERVALGSHSTPLFRVGCVGPATAQPSVGDSVPPLPLTGRTSSPFLNITLLFVSAFPFSHHRVPLFLILFTLKYTTVPS
jgi:hypothetical protein